jgi:hypothetical protein
MKIKLGYFFNYFWTNICIAYFVILSINKANFYYFNYKLYTYIDSMFSFHIIYCFRHDEHPPCCA